MMRLKEGDVATMVAILNTIQQYFSSEIILMESPHSKDSLLENLFEMNHLPVIHLSNQFAMQNEHTCPTDGEKAESLSNFSHLPWRDRRKSAISWLRPKSLNDTRTLVQYLLR